MSPVTYAVDEVFSQDSMGVQGGIKEPIQIVHHQLGLFIDVVCQQVLITYK